MSVSRTARNASGEATERSGSKEVLVAFFSWTGTTKKVAKSIANTLQGRARVTMEEIRPLRKRSYLEWLALSFFPYSRVGIAQHITDLSSFDALVLGSPKWTLGCPPVRAYINSLQNYEGKKVLLFLTYGGFDYSRYAREMSLSFKRKGMDVKGILLISRREAEADTCVDAVDRFCDAYLWPSTSLPGRLQSP